MPEIKFTATPVLPFDIAHLAYKAGDVVDLPEASCRRWIRRGVAEYHVVAKEMPRMVAPTIDDFEPLPEPDVVEVVVEEAVEVGDVIVFEADAVEEDAPKRRGRKPRAN